MNDLHDLTYPVQGPLPNDGSTAQAEQTVPTLQGVLHAYRNLEREMFAHPEDANRYAEILSLTRQQLRDHRLGENVDSQMIGRGNRVNPLSPEQLEQLVEHGAATFVATGTRVMREKTARQVAEDDLLRAGLAPILAALTIAQMDAVRHVHWFRMSLRDAGDALGITFKAVDLRLRAAYASIRAAIPVGGYRKVRAWLVSEGQKDRATRVAA